MKAIEIDRVRSISGGDMEFEKMLFGLFENTADRVISALESLSGTSEDVTAWQENCHELKGASANIGAKTLAGICEEAENCDVQERVDKFGLIRQELGRVRDDIAAMDG